MLFCVLRKPLREQDVLSTIDRVLNLNQHVDAAARGCLKLKGPGESGGSPREASLFGELQRLGKFVKICVAKHREHLV